ncbi:putative nuclease HARBI1 [Rhagoletis pomonella]|uniref:putative nuclease HARBI1 n=1 Tax=Rhagoletis pomonella TaxID=28610 RepID=UPI00177E3BA1|nr:putative nuclease HARBI1 [Rhagoletis pomonella]
MLGLAQSTVSVVLSEVLDVLESFICQIWIKFNYTEAELQQAKSHFYNKSRIPEIIGCIDGTHIKIVAPRKELQHLYYNRKGFFSINAMVVCDHTMKIRYINAKNPGATHDSMVFNMSSLKTQLEQQHLNGPRNTWLLGDAGYALKPYLMTPFRKSEEGSLQRAYNKQHAKGRTLHNICLFYNVQILDEEKFSNVTYDDDVGDVEVEPVDNSQAEDIRNEILRTL